MSDFRIKLNKAKEVYEGMTLLIKICQESSSDVWDVHWDCFWEMSNQFPFKVDWYDPDTSYEDDVMSRYLAIESFMESLDEQHNI